MNFNSILKEIEQHDPEVYERTSERRDVIKNWSRKFAMAALPFALGSMFKKAYGKSTATVIEVLNYALTLEYLEAEFYTIAVDMSPFPNAASKGAFTTIRDHEVAHVNFLKTAISGAGGTPVSKPTFDFSGGNGSGNGPFATAFTDYSLLLAVAQTFEDTGVRAYKGAAGDLITNNDVLQAALQIHSVEARHAAHIRSMRAAQGANVKPWITGDSSGINSTAVQPSYDGEDVTTQAGVNIVGINGQAISADDASESFDEPLTMQQVLAIVDPFIV